MRISRILGGLIIVLSIAFGAFYVLWFFGFMPIDPELAVKIPVLLIVLGACFVAGFIGYVMITAPTPSS